MSEENVEIVARSMDAFNRGDLEGFLECVTPDIEWVPVMGAMERDGSFRGRTGVEAYFDALRDAWENLAFAPGNEVRDLGEKTLMVGRLQGRGRGSGVTVDTPIAVLYDHRGGQISRIQGFYDPAEALKAVGLAEYAMSRLSRSAAAPRSSSECRASCGPPSLMGSRPAAPSLRPLIAGRAARWRPRWPSSRRRR